MMLYLPAEMPEGVQTATAGRDGTVRENPVKHRLIQGGAAFGAMVFEFFTPGIAQIVRAAGAEFLLYDMEHSGAGIDTIKQQMAWCRGIGLVPLVRVPAAQYHFVARVLDAGAMGIMVPMVESAAQAAEIVAATRYPPKGVRGAGFGMAHDDYEGGSVAEKIAAILARTQVIVQIETPKGIAAVDEIAALDGVDVLWLGHFDLTNFMGIPFTHPDYLKAVDSILAAARRHGKVAGFMAMDDVWARDYYAKGFRMMAVGPDQGLLQQSLSRGLGVLREAAQAARR
jgi:2-dehydro-3-deoxyglucarate aldolase/4-hydroxy-2-oxoheptanedioate aldolase